MSVKMTVDFSDDFRLEDGFAVYDNALLFEAGDYPDKQFEITPDEMADAIKDFKPIKGNLDHTEWLAGEACEVPSVFIDAKDPKKLRGVVKVPVWLNDALKPNQKKLSAEWHPTNKTLDGIALCTNPRIEHAALVTAFAKNADHKTNHGQQTLQMIHDYAAQSGAVCDPDPDNKDAQFSQAIKRVAFISHPERRGLQRIHDISTKHGSKCNSSYVRSSYFKQDSPMPNKLVAAFKAIFAKAETEIPADDPTITAFIADLEAVDAPAPVEKTEPVVPVVASKGIAPKVEDSAQFKAQEARIAELEARDTLREATSWAQSEVDAKRALPKEKPSLIASFVQAARDDKTGGLATFNGESKTRVDLLKAAQASRPQHILFQEVIPNEIPDGSVVVYNKTETKPEVADPKELAELRKFSSTLDWVDQLKKRRELEALSK